MVLYSDRDEYTCAEGEYTSGAFSDFMEIGLLTEGEVMLVDDAKKLIRKFESAGLGRTYHEIKKCIDAHIANCAPCRQQYEKAKRNYEIQDGALEQMLEEESEEL